MLSSNFTLETCTQLRSKAELKIPIVDAHGQVKRAYFGPPGSCAFDTFSERRAIDAIDELLVPKSRPTRRCCVLEAFIAKDLQQQLERPVRTLVPPKMPDGSPSLYPPVPDPDDLRASIDELMQDNTSRHAGRYRLFQALCIEDKNHIASKTVLPGAMTPTLGWSKRLLKEVRLLHPMGPDSSSYLVSIEHMLWSFVPTSQG